MDMSTGKRSFYLEIYHDLIHRYEAQQCCVNNYGFLAQPSSQAEHDLIKARLQTSEGTLSNKC